MKDKTDLIKDITEHLDQSLETIDPKILSRIRAARYNALEKKRPGFMQWALPVGGIAVAAVILTFSINLFTGPVNKPASQTAEVIETTTDKPEHSKEEIPLENISKPRFSLTR